MARVYSIALLIGSLGLASGCMSRQYDNPVDPDAELAPRLLSLTEEQGPLASRAGTVWVLDASRGEVVVLAPEAGTEVLRVRLPGLHPGGLALEGDRLWLSLPANGEVFRLDPQTGQREEQVLLPVNSPAALAFDGGVLYVYDPGSGLILAYLPAERRVLWERSAPSDILDMTVRTNELLMLDGNGRRLERWDPDTGTPLGTTDLPLTAIGIAADGNRLFLLAADGRLYVAG